MHQGVVTCNENETLRNALKLMGDNTIRSIVITDAACSLCGIVSQTDLVNASLNDPVGWGDTPVSKVMTRNVLTVTVDTPLNAAAKTLIENHVHRIIVVDETDICNPVGVLSMSDIVRDLMGET